MPNSESEKVTSSLAWLLRLSPEQAARLVTMLDETFLDRCEELRRYGVPASEAARKALGELHEPESSHVTQLPSASSVAPTSATGLVLLMAGLFVLAACVAWLASRELGRDPLGERTASGSAAAASLSGVPVTGDSLPPEFYDSSAALPPGLTRLTWDAPVTIPIADLPKLFRDELHLPLVIDTDKLIDLGINGQVTFTFEPQTPVYLAFNRLRSMDLDWYFEDGVVRLTTADATGRHLVTRSYPVANLLQRIDANVLPDVIMNHTGQEEYGPWADIHGTGGTISLVNKLLNVRQTHRVHSEVSALSSVLENPGHETFVAEPARHGDIWQTLRSKRIDVDFDGVPLDVAIHAVSTRSGLHIGIDEASLADIGEGSDRVVRQLKTESSTVQDVLEWLLTPLDLAAVVKDGMVLVTSANRANQSLHIVVYDLSDLAAPRFADTFSEALLELTGNETYGPWVDIHGTGGACDFAAPGLLVLRQTDRVLDEIRLLIASHRATLGSSSRADR